MKDSLNYTAKILTSEQKLKLNNLLLKAASKHLGTSSILDLLAQGADVNAEDHYGWTALMYSANSSNKELVQILIDHGANVNATNKTGGEALGIATLNRRTEIVKTLIKNGANVNIANNGGTTALMSASVYGEATIAQILIDSGAEVNAAEKKGSTSLMYACTNGNTRIVKILTDSGADVNATDNGKRTSMLEASVYRHKDIVEILIENGADLIAESLTNRARILECITSPKTLTLLAVMLPEGELQNEVKAKLPENRDEELQAWIDLKNNLAKKGLTKDQQRRIIAFKLGIETTRNNLTYSAALLPEEDLGNELIQKFNQQNPQAPLNQEKVKALRCFVYGVKEMVDGKEEVKSLGFTKTIRDETLHGTKVIDYPRAGEVILELLHTKDALYRLTSMLDSDIQKQEKFQAGKMPDKEFNDWHVTRILRTQTPLGSYLHKKDSIFYDQQGLEIFESYMKNHLAKRNSQAVVTSSSSSNDSPTATPETPEAARLEEESKTRVGKNGGRCTIM